MRFRCFVVFSVPALCLFYQILCLSFIYSFSFWLRATLLHAVQRITLLFLLFSSFIDVHAYVFWSAFIFFGIFSQLSKIACIKSSTKLSSSCLKFLFFLVANLVVFRKKSGRFTNFGSGNTIIICLFWFLFCLDIFKKFDIFIKFVFMFVFCFVFFVHLIELMSFFSTYCDFCDT